MEVLLVGTAARGQSPGANGQGISGRTFADAGRQAVGGGPRHHSPGDWVLDPDGKPTARLEVVKVADVARLDQASWQAERDRMLKACNQCHSADFARQQLQYGDGMIRNADRLMAEAIRIVAGLYKDGLVPKPKNYAYPFPDLLTFHDAPTVIEQRLFIMFLEHRMRTFQGTFHSSPDYALWYGWSEMQRDLTEIKEMAAEIRRTGHASAALPSVEGNAWVYNGN